MSTQSSNSSRNSDNRSRGLGIPGVLTIVFVVLKLVGVVSWSWWWVLSPLWISLCASIAVLLVLGLVALLVLVVRR